MNQDNIKKNEVIKPEKHTINKGVKGVIESIVSTINESERKKNIKY
jgi:hypothetical protein